MSAATAADFACVAGMDSLLQMLERIGADAGWAKREPSLWPAPRKSFVPARWSYELGKAALDAAGRMVSTELAERRNLILFNPVPGNRYATARTIVAAYQMVLPGETARSHRHTPNALRLVVDAAPGACTVVDGRKIPMLPGDVILTPGWHWHGHANESDRSAYWIDFLDVPTVHFFESMFFEPHPAGSEGGAVLEEASPLRFALSRTRQLLDAAAQGSQAGERVIELGPPRMATLRLEILRMEPAASWTPPRTTANSVFAVIEGSGRSEVEGLAFDWQRGDVFVVPAWRAHQHRPCERSHVLRVSDEPMLERLGWLRRESAL